MFQRMRDHDRNIRILSEYTGYQNRILVDYGLGEVWVLPSHIVKTIKKGLPFSEMNPRDRPSKDRKYVATDTPPDINKKIRSLHKCLTYMYGEVSYESSYVDEETEIDILIDQGRYSLKPSWVRREHQRIKLEHSRAEAEAKNRTAAENFYRKLKEEFPNAELLSEYKNARTSVLVNFKCGHEPEYVSPARIKRGKGCPLCTRSAGEVRIYESLKRYRDHCYIFWDKSAIWTDDPLLSKKRYDFQVFFPAFNVLLILEWHGQQHFRPVKVYGGEEALKNRETSDKHKLREAQKVGYYHAFEVRKTKDLCRVKGEVDDFIDFFVSNLNKYPTVTTRAREIIRQKYNI